MAVTGSEQKKRKITGELKQLHWQEYRNSPQPAVVSSVRISASSNLKANVHTPGSGYVLLHHVMGETDGERSVWSYVEGGIGSVSMAIANAAKEAGAQAQIFTNAEAFHFKIINVGTQAQALYSYIMQNSGVSEVQTEDSGIVKGVLLADGTRVESSVILSNATPYRNFVELVPANVLPEEFVGAIKNSDYSSVSISCQVPLFS
ncbi:unnamed protein product [Arabis nemorensis]|uniref:Amine oxidase domain-containing protein n=1 Tax=Arabis nemorensis TaxID=586526 RepID=A0A565BBM3_9BRAS|nr:unnamed protein product [Arabis nemorensis]